MSDFVNVDDKNLNVYNQTFKESINKFLILMFETGLIRFISQGDRFYRAQLVKQLEPNANDGHLLTATCNVSCKGSLCTRGLIYAPKRNRRFGQL